MNPRPLVRRARLFLVGVTLLWGASFPLMRGLQLAQKAHAPHLPDAVVACADFLVRFGLAALILFPFVAAKLARGITPREWSQALGLGLLASGGGYLQTLGLTWTDASISAFLTQTYVLVIPLIVAVRDRRRPGWRVAAACGLVAAGTVCLSPGLLTHFLLGPGEAFTLISALFFAGMVVWIERPIYAENRADLMTFLMFAVIALVSTPLYFLLGGRVASIPLLFDRPPLYLLILALVLFCTLLNFMVINAWQRFVSATEAGFIYCLEPVIAALLATFLPGWLSRLGGINYPNESPHAGLFFGGGLIIAATVLAATRRLKAQA